MKFLYWCLLFVFFFKNSFSQEVFYTNPYLQFGHQPSSHSLEVLWHVTDEDAFWRVEFKNTKKEKWIKSGAITYKKIHVAKTVAHRVYNAGLTGLSSGNTFIYRILKNNKEVFSAQGQSPKPNEQPYRFVVIGDIAAETKEQKALAKRIYESKPDFVAVPGDIVYESGLVSEYREKFWPVYNADVASAEGVPIMRSVPWMAAVGNHDADSRNLDNKPDALAYFMYWSQPLNGPNNKEGSATVPLLSGSNINKNAFYTAAGDAYPRMTNFGLDYGNAHWTVLDADTYMDWTDSTMKAWVKNDLVQSKSATWHFVMFHHPGFNSSIEHAEQQQMRLLAPIFEEGNVDIVFNGHVHNYQRSFPMKFAPAKNGTLLTGGKDGKTIRGRVVPGLWALDKNFNGQTNTKANGVIYIVTGAGGRDLYNPEQEARPETWQPFTNKFISIVHSLTVADVKGNSIIIQQLTAEGKVLGSFTITK